MPAFETNIYVLGYLLGNNLFYFKNTDSANSVQQIYFKTSFNTWVNIYLFFLDLEPLPLLWREYEDR